MAPCATICPAPAIALPAKPLKGCARSLCVAVVTKPYPGTAVKAAPVAPAVTFAIAC